MHARALSGKTVVEIMLFWKVIYSGCFGLLSWFDHSRIMILVYVSIRSFIQSEFNKDCNYTFQNFCLSIFWDMTGNQTETTVAGNSELHIVRSIYFRSFRSVLLEHLFALSFNLVTYALSSNAPT